LIRLAERLIKLADGWIHVLYLWSTDEVNGRVGNSGDVMSSKLID